MTHYPSHEPPKKAKPRRAKAATQNPERFSTMKEGKRLHISEEKRQKQGVVQFGGRAGDVLRKKRKRGGAFSEINRALR